MQMSRGAQVGDTGDMEGQAIPQEHGSFRRTRREIRGHQTNKEGT